ncbi:MAG: pyruvate dehydrogenase (acetyl-transferring) E1 component subunit alpha [Chloroflexi bacterium]|nr:pyruvate dehydrogenase (acetyl-transferring) E1 component subunit alpha [Chloroflexota bacterium]
MKQRSQASAQPRAVSLPLDKETLLHFLNKMILIRRVEEKVAEIYTRAKAGGFVHLNIGEEAAIVGAASSLADRDYLFTSYRDHGWALVKGVAPRAVMAELYGKATGCSKGRGGSMHLFDSKVRFMGGYAIVGGMIPIATGTALAVTYRGTDEVAMCVFGEGATNIGSFHEGLNVAKLWQLPVVFVCTNNLYGMGTAVRRASSVSEIYRKACAYDMVAERIDGMDVVATRDACLRAVERARKDHEPSLVELVTYRFRGHSMADPARYRTDDEVRWWRERDPISSLEQKMKDSGMLTQQEIDDIEAAVSRVVTESVQYAESSPAPGLDDLYKDVYVQSEGQ